MSNSDEFIIFTDGGARGNPGPAAFAFTLQRPGGPLLEEKGFLGESTNNIAEYTALVRALEKAKDLGCRRLRIQSDSELLVKQMNGEYKVKNEGLRPLFQRAQQLRREFDSVEISHIRREQNKVADRLCNEALDEAGGKRPSPSPSSNAGSAASPSRAASGNKPSPKISADVHDQVVECLQGAAVAWSYGNPNNPPVDAVWEQVLSILMDAGKIK